MIQDCLLSTLNETAKTYGLSTKRFLKQEKVVNIVIDSNGTYVGIERGEYLVPRGVFEDNDTNHARFLVERLQKSILRVPKYESQRVIFWEQLKQAAAAIPKSKLAAVMKFFKKLNVVKQRRIAKDVSELCGSKANPLMAFVEFHRNGNVSCFDKLAQDWWKKEHKRQTQERFGSCFRGVCQVTGKTQIIPNCSPMPVNKKTGAIISANRPAFEFGGYKGLESSHVGIDAAINVSLAIEHVDSDLLSYRGKKMKTSFRIDDTHRILSWFCDPASAKKNDMIAMERSFYGTPKEDWEVTDDSQSPLSHINWIRDKYEPPKNGGTAAMRPDDDTLFCTLLAAKNPGESRLIILEKAFLTIPMLRRNILRWHDDLHLESTFRKKGGTIVQRPPISVKRAMNILFDSQGKGAVPTHICRAIHTAFFHGHSINIQHLNRLNSRVVKAIITQKHFWGLLSLLKLCLIRKEIDVPNTWTREKAESSPAFAIGSILFLTAYAQSPKTRGLESMVPKKYLQWCSTNPARAFAAFSRNFEIYLDRMKRDSAALRICLLRARGYLLGLIGDLPSSLSPTERSELLLGFGLMREILQSQKFVDIFPGIKKEKNDSE